MLVLWSDRGPSDFWCAPSHTFMCDLATKHSIKIIANTTAAGHSKWTHDQIGGTVTTFLSRSLNSGQLKINSNSTKSSQVVLYLNQHFNQSHNNSITRYFHEIPISDVYIGDSPVNSLNIPSKYGKGIKTYHCALIVPNSTQIKYRICSCYCDQCQNSEFNTTCNQRSFCGRWISINIQKHPSYQSLLNKTNNIDIWTHTQTQAPLRSKQLRPNKTKIKTKHP